LRALQRKGVIDLIPGSFLAAFNSKTFCVNNWSAAHRPRRCRPPILAEEHIEKRYQIDPQLFQPQPHYLLKVQGMSMKNAGIWTVI